MGEHLMTTSPLFLESESFNNNLNINHECVEVSDDEHSVLANASEADLIELISTDDIVQSAWIQTLNDNFDNPGQQQPLANTSYTEHCSDQSTTFDSVIQQRPDISDFFNYPQQQQQQQVVANNHDEQPLFTLTAVLPSSIRRDHLLLYHHHLLLHHHLKKILIQEHLLVRN